MKKTILGPLVAAILVVALNSINGYSQAAEQKLSITAVSQVGKADYSRLITIQEVENITGFTDLQLKSIDSKRSGEAADLTFSTPEGQRIVMVQVLWSRDFDMYYNQFCSQDFKAWPGAFWGPKGANPPSMFWFSKGDTLILISCDNDAAETPCVVPDAIVKIARIIAGRISAQGI